MSRPEDAIQSRLEGHALEVALTRMYLMPNYATEHERRVVAMGGHTEAMEAAIAQLRTLGDPATCPPEWLYLLAWSLSVDVWDAAWPDSVKRAVCAASWDVHIYRGTPYSIRRELQAMGVTVTLVPWFEQNPPGPRATGKVTAFVEEDAAEQHAGRLFDGLAPSIRKSVQRNKPLTRHLDIEAGVSSRARMAIGAAMQHYAVIEVGPLILSDKDLLTVPVFGAAAQVSVCIDVLEARA